VGHGLAHVAQHVGHRQHGEVGNALEELARQARVRHALVHGLAEQASPRARRPRPRAARASPGPRGCGAGRARPARAPAPRAPPAPGGHGHTARAGLRRRSGEWRAGTGPRALGAASPARRSRRARASCEGARRRGRSARAAGRRRGSRAPDTARPARRGSRRRAARGSPHRDRAARRAARAGTARRRCRGTRAARWSRRPAPRRAGRRTGTRESRETTATTRCAGASRVARSSARLSVAGPRRGAAPARTKHQTCGATREPTEAPWRKSRTSAIIEVPSVGGRSGSGCFARVSVQRSCHRGIHRNRASDKRGDLRLDARTTTRGRPM